MFAGGESASGNRANGGAGLLIDAVGWRVMPSIFSDGLGFGYLLISLSDPCIDFYSFAIASFTSRPRIADALMVLDLRAVRKVRAAHASERQSRFSLAPAQAEAVGWAYDVRM